MKFPIPRTHRKLILAVSVSMLFVYPTAGQDQSESQQPQPEPIEQPAGIRPVNTNEPSAPVDPNSYVIGAEDVLAVVVWHERDVSGAVTVRPDGKITLPLIGELQAAGKTPQELKTTVTEKLSQFLNRPEVMVSVQAVRSKKYYLTGQVGRTGAFPLVVPTTVLEALSSAGGFQQWAKTKKIRILRDGGRTTLKFNYNEVIKGKNLDQNIYLQNGDNIIVP